MTSTALEIQSIANIMRVFWKNKKKSNQKSKKHLRLSSEVFLFT